MDTGVVAVIGLCVFLALWYGGGYLYNRRRGQRLFHWLERGLDILGGEKERGWIGSPASGARINVHQAEPPFQRLEFTLLLENRELPPLWLFERLIGKRDWLVIRGTLRSPPRGEMEIGSASRKAARRREQPWEWREGPKGLAVAYQGRAVQHQLTAFEPWLETYGAHLYGLTWRKTDPHIQLQMQVNGLLTRPSRTFLADLQTAVKRALPSKRDRRDDCS
jgi:hypothetical protein